MLLDKWASDDVIDFWSLCGFLDQKKIDQVLHLLRVAIRNWLVLV